MDDTQLRQRVIEQLESAPGIDPSRIDVSVNGGIVTLQGQVPSRTEKLIAFRAAQRPADVRAVHDRLTVEPSDEKTAAAPDEDLAKRAAQLLQWDIMIPDGSIQVSVRDGRITLTGHVPWEYQRRRADDTVRDMIGITGVTNLIEIHPNVSTADVAQCIRDALERSAAAEAEGIRITVRNATVRLEGTIRSWHDHEVIRQAVWSAPGVEAVEDYLQID